MTTEVYDWPQNRLLWGRGIGVPRGQGHIPPSPVNVRGELGYPVALQCESFFQSLQLAIRESSFNITRGGGDEDIETRSLKF